MPLTVDTPAGHFLLTVERGALTGAALCSPSAPLPKNEENPLLTRAAEQLQEYFKGMRTVFDLPMSPAGTPFQRKVWAELCRVPFGECVSYGELAARLGMPGAARAVGGAVGRNPLLIFIPCHRVLAKDGIGGFSSGLPLKKFLLELERIPYQKPRAPRA